MPQRPGLDKIELHLVRVLHVLITERSVCQAARALQRSQPAVSAQSKRLCERARDAILLRAGPCMAATNTALGALEPTAALLRDVAKTPSTHGLPRRAAVSGARS
jgi:DNA-binding transcriptional LysR family regulator